MTDLRTYEGSNDPLTIEQKAVRLAYAALNTEDLTALIDAIDVADRTPLAHALRRYGLPTLADFVTSVVLQPHTTRDGHNTLQRRQPL